MGRRVCWSIALLVFIGLAGCASQSPYTAGRMPATQMQCAELREEHAANVERINFLNRQRNEPVRVASSTILETIKKAVFFSGGNSLVVPSDREEELKEIKALAERNEILQESIRRCRQ